MRHGLILGILLAAVFFAAPSVKVHAAPAEPGPSQVTQPDGTVVTVVLKGDEWRNWVETLEGLTIAKGNDGVWYYVKGYEGKTPLLSGIPAQESAPKWIEPHIKPH